MRKKKSFMVTNSIMKTNRILQTGMHTITTPSAAADKAVKYCNSHQPSQNIYAQLVGHHNLDTMCSLKSGGLDKRGENINKLKYELWAKKFRNPLFIPSAIVTA